MLILPLDFWFDYEIPSQAVGKMEPLYSVNGYLNFAMSSKIFQSFV